jgi:hypothetical protein
LNHCYRKTPETAAPLTFSTEFPTLMPLVEIDDPAAIENIVAVYGPRNARQNLPFIQLKETQRERWLWPPCWLAGIGKENQKAAVVEPVKYKIAPTAAVVV